MNIERIKGRVKNMAPKMETLNADENESDNGGGIASTTDNTLNFKNRIIGKQQSEDEDRLFLLKGTKLETEINNYRITNLGNGSEIVYFPRFLSYDDAWRCFDYLNTQIPWTRPTIRVFGRSCVQPRDTCYVASEGLPKLVYSGYQPQPCSWHRFPLLLQLLRAVEEAIPGSRYNSLLLNRYSGGNDYVGWHSDDESLYGPTPQIASLSFGCERDFFLKKRPSKSSPSQVVEKKSKDESMRKRLKRSNNTDQHSFTLKHGSLLVMRGYTQRDWIHSVPKRAKVDAVRINLTFRLVL